MQAKLTVLVAGVGGASLGTELIKCLSMTNRYEVLGCDISPIAFGLHDPTLSAAFRVDKDDYIGSLLSHCRRHGVDWIIPGGEQPMILMNNARGTIEAAGCRVLINSPAVMAICSDKAKTFDVLPTLGFSVPKTFEIVDDDDLRQMDPPYIVKPSTGSGGSAMVFFATDRDEAGIYAAYIKRSGGRPICQEYIDVAEGEFTIGVLSRPDASVLGSVALRRSFDSKLSVASRGRGGLVSSGYSQGFIGDFPELRGQAEQIARSMESRGPINIQARVRDGRLMPFEINPRLSASSYLRAMAGFNEVDLYLRTVALGEAITVPPLKEGWYLRSLTETFVSAERVNK